MQSWRQRLLGEARPGKGAGGAGAAGGQSPLHVAAGVSLFVRVEAPGPEPRGRGMRSATGQKGRSPLQAGRRQREREALLFNLEGGDSLANS